MIPSLVKKLLSLGIQMVGDEIRFYFENGFYKSNGSAYLVQTNPDLDCMLHSRYEMYESVSSVKDVVNVSYDWWCRSKERADGWRQPDPAWVDLYIEQGLVKKKMVAVYE